jgi:hypothetical protein
MIKITKRMFEKIVSNVVKTKKFRDEFSSNFSEQACFDSEMYAIPRKDEAYGIVLLESGSDLYVLRFYRTGRITDVSGRARTIICDFCSTRVSGNLASRIKFESIDKKRSVYWLCCYQLNCSQNARGTTDTAKLSRIFIKETISDEKRVERLKSKISKLIEYLGINPYEVINE